MHTTIILLKYFIFTSSIKKIILYNKVPQNAGWKGQFRSTAGCGVSRGEASPAEAGTVSGPAGQTMPAGSAEETESLFT